MHTTMKRTELIYQLGDTQTRIDELSLIATRKINTTLHVLVLRRRVYDTGEVPARQLTFLSILQI